MDPYFSSAAFIVEIGKHLELADLLKLERLSKQTQITIRNTTWNHKTDLCLHQITHELLKYKFTNCGITQVPIKIDANYIFHTYETEQNSQLLPPRVYLFKNKIQLVHGFYYIETDRLVEFLADQNNIKYEGSETIDCICVHLEIDTLQNIKKDTDQFCLFKTYDRKNNIIYNNGKATQTIKNAELVLRDIEIHRETFRRQV